MSTTIFPRINFLRDFGSRMKQRIDNGRVYFGSLLEKIVAQDATLDLRFAASKSLTDAVSGQDLVDFTRASGGTYVDSDGLIKNSVVNLLLRSEDFSTTWIRFASTVTSNEAQAPDGTITADYFSATNPSSAFPSVSQVVSVNQNKDYTISLYARAKEVSSISVQLYGNSTTYIGAFSTSSLDNGWTRISKTINSASYTSIQVRVLFSNTSVTWSGTQGIYIWGAQLEESSTVGEYVKTTSSINGAPRFDHDPVTGESLGLLIEEQRTNFALSSATFQPTSGGSPAAYVVDQVAPDGTTSGSRQTAAAPRTFADYLLGTNAQYTFSVYVKGVGEGIGQNIRLQLKNAASDTIITTGAFFALTSTWTRISVTGTTNGATTGARVEVLGPTLGAPPGTVFWGEQLEVGASPTSYIPTTSATVTRNADVASITGSNFSSWYRQDEGTVFAETRLDRQNTIAGSAILGIETGVTVSEAIYMFYRASGGTGFTMWDGGTLQADFTPYTVVPANTVTRQAGAIKLNDSVAIGGGESRTTDTSCTLPTPDRLFIGYSTVASRYLSGHIRRLTFFNRRLPNATLESITKP